MYTATCIVCSLPDLKELKELKEASYKLLKNSICLQGLIAIIRGALKTHSLCKTAKIHAEKVMRCRQHSRK